jgi:glucose/mannose transport system permease protein
MTAVATPSSAARRPWRMRPARIGIYAFLLSASLFFLMPLYIMLVTSFKSMDEIRLETSSRFPSVSR